jgi:hypothetical protein
MATPNEMTAKELDEKLRQHFISDKDQLDLAGAGAVYLTEVTAPGNSGRRADAVHIGLWSSRGAGTIEVCELKVSRADWLVELKKPQKAEAWWPYCHHFWLVVPHEGIVKDGELPKGWGLMMPSPRGRRFKVLVKPEERSEEDFHLTIPLLITLLKNTETTRTNALRRQSDELRRQFYDREREIQRQRGVFSEKDRRRLELLERLEKALGVELAEYGWERKLEPEGAARALQALARGEAAMDAAKDRAESAVRELDRAARAAQETADRLRKEMGIK